MSVTVVRNKFQLAGLIVCVLCPMMLLQCYWTALQRMEPLFMGEGLRLAFYIMGRMCHVGDSLNAASVCCNEEADDAAEGQDYLPLDDEADDAAALLEARLLLRGATSQSSPHTPSVGTPPLGPSVSAAATASGVVSSASPPLRKRGRPNGSKKTEDPTAWEPKEVSLTITGGSFYIDPVKLGEMEAFLEDCCLAGMFALEGRLSVTSPSAGALLGSAALKEVVNINRKCAALLLCLQGVLQMRAKTVRGITIAIKQHLGWDWGK